MNPQHATIVALLRHTTMTCEEIATVAGVSAATVNTVRRAAGIAKRKRDNKYR